jgi:copper chaperone
MANAILTVNGMSCDHCVAAVTKAIESVPGTSGVEVSLADGTASFDYTPDKTDMSAVKEAIEDQGYDVA